MNMLKDLAIEAAGRMRKAAAEKSSAPGQDLRVEALLSRISEGMQPAERHANMDELKAALADSPAAAEAFAGMGVPIMCAIVRDDQDDLELVQGALEVLLAAAGGPIEASVEAAEPSHPYSLTCAAIVQDAGSLQLMLELLETEAPLTEDFYVRHSSVQLLSRLVCASPETLQAAVLDRQQGLVRLMDLLTHQEAIRNEALLLLIKLTQGHEEIQKIVAYRDAFDTLFGIVAEEGYAAGGVLVQDCVLLLQNLLRDNPANQLMFRESGFLANAHLLVDVPAHEPGSLAGAASAIEAHLAGAPAPGGPGALSEDVAANLNGALELVSALLTPTSPAALAPGACGGVEAARAKGEMAAMCLEANHAMLARTPLRDKLLQLALITGQGCACHVRCQALRTLQRVVHKRQAAQDALGNASVQLQGRPAPCLQALLHRLLTTTNETEAVYSCQLFQALCEGNSDGQLAWTAMLPRGTPKPLTYSQPFGDMLLAGVMADVAGGALPGTAACAYACAALAALVDRNPAAQARALQISVKLRAGRLAAAKSCDVAGLCMSQLGQAWSREAQSSNAALEGPPSTGSERRQSAHDAPPVAPARRGAAGWAVPGVLCLLVSLCSGCPAAVHMLLRDLGHVPLLLEVMQGAQGADAAVVAGLAALLCGCCILADASTAEESKQQAALVQVLSNRLGLRIFFGALESFSESDAFHAAQAAHLQHQEVHGHGLYPGLLSASLCKQATDLIPKVKERALADFARPPDAIAPSTEARGDGDGAVIAQLQQELRRLQARNTELEAAAASTAPPAEQDRAASHAAGGAPVAHVAAERDALQQQVQDLQAAAAAQQQQMQDLQRAQAEGADVVQKLEADMAALSDAYQDLQSDCTHKDSEIETLQAALARPQGGEPGGGAASANASLSELLDVRQEMDDLLVCLGQEEQKVEVLSKKLQELGVDADALVAHIVAEAEGSEGEAQAAVGSAGVDVGSWVEGATSDAVHV